ncbi:MAG: hemerythrin domain-containing protein [Deltaproteobacteria bacterium]|nr:hemerythrin domain-containing protein [Deltaproteobacteria bacterium]
MRSESAHDWRSRRAADLINHLLEVHHAPTRTMLTKIDRLLARVLDVVCVRPPLDSIATIHDALRDDLLAHMTKEEREVFPWIAALDEAQRDGRPAPPSPFGRFARPVARSVVEHESIRSAFIRLRAATGDLQPPDDACRAMRALYSTFAELERDLDEHMRLEHDVLFPRAEELERAVREETTR